MMQRKTTRLFIVVSIMAVFISACGKAEMSKSSVATVEETSAAASDMEEGKTQGEVEEIAETGEKEPEGDKNDEQIQAGDSETEEDTEKMLQMKINDTVVNVSWEENESVSALMELCKDSPIEIQMSMYGGFEQVGSLGTDLPRADTQTTTSSGDIVLYSGNQIVVFYGSNSWSYTRLGHITDQDDAGMTKLLSNGDVTITISMEENQ